MVCRHGHTVRVEPNDLVELRKEGQAVRNEEDDTVPVGLSQVLENLSFRRHVDGGKGIVENHERPTMEKGAGQSDAGLLTAGEALASFADRCLNP